MNHWLELAHMQYAGYIWGSYGVVIGYLFIQGVIPWWRWQNFVKQKKSLPHESDS